jgi:hypothetical protein
MPAGTRSGTGRFTRTVANAARDAKAAELHGQGWTYQRIADELGFASKGKAHEAVQRAFADIPTEGAEAAKLADLERLDRLIEQAWAVMLRPHLAVSNGRVVRRRTGEYECHDDGTERLDDKGQPIPVYADVMDDWPVLAAIAHIRTLIERRAKIYGYEAPSRSRVEVITSDVIESEIARLEGELQANDRVTADTGIPGPPALPA